MRRLSITAGKPRPTITSVEGADLVVGISAERAAGPTAMRLRLDLVDLLAPVAAPVVAPVVDVDLVGGADHRDQVAVG